MIAERLRFGAVSMHWVCGVSRETVREVLERCSLRMAGVVIVEWDSFRRKREFVESRTRGARFARVEGRSVGSVSRETLPWTLGAREGRCANWQGSEPSRS